MIHVISVKNDPANESLNRMWDLVTMQKQIRAQRLIWEASQSPRKDLALEVLRCLEHLCLQEYQSIPFESLFSNQSDRNSRSQSND